MNELEKTLEETDNENAKLESNGKKLQAEIKDLLVGSFFFFPCC